ncbi:MAG: hypothetical protein HFI29_11585 [Lachnospiraceae bacterium]|nr:hypothetical protein [Lachnospiraceae bacterium]
MTKKKSGFLTFLFSWIPGAGEMYMGFMKMGVSLMGLFWGIISLSVLTNTGYLILVDVIVWFYSFFHAHNLRAMDDEDFYALEDHYLIPVDTDREFWSRITIAKYRKLLAGILILFGVAVLWNTLLDLLYWALPEYIWEYVRSVSYFIPQLVLGIGIIAVGVLLIRGKKQELLMEEDRGDEHAGEADHSHS